ncbi:MAG: molybdopterin converting factor subunit 1 [Anaerolineae bacterium]|nr:molybdopterin converting factor subunit 1 [Anaerolineae bacterium]
MKVTVKLFAWLRQRLGRPELELELPDGATVADLQARLQAGYPQLHLDDGDVLIAVNLRYAPPDRVLGEGDEVALIPPVGGG